MVPRARLELARQYDPSQDFKSCASTNFATGALRQRRVTFTVRSVNPCLSMPNLLRTTNQLSGRLLRQQWLPLLTLFSLCTWFDIEIEDQFRVLSNLDGSMRILLALAQGLSGLVESTGIFFVCSWGLPKAYPLTGPQYLAQPFHRPYLASFCAEYLRVMGKTLLWGLVLIIPGIVRYIQFGFVPLIVFFLKPYDEGQVDALALSTRLANRRLPLLITVFLTTLAIAAGLTLAPNRWPEMQGYTARFGLYFLAFFLAIWTYSLMVIVFAQEIKNESDL